MMGRMKAVFCVLMAAALLACTGIRAEASTETGAAYVEVFGKQFDPHAELLDLSDIPLESTEQVEEILPLFPNLKQVDMCRCGISDEEMAEFRRKYPDIQIVWEVVVCKYYGVRTDAVWFMPFQYHIPEGRTDFDNLKYCTQMQLMDFGHYELEDISFVAAMPQLKSLLLCDTGLKDISVVGSCTSLEYLELFANPFYDFAPLINLTNLRNLNISFTPYAKMGTDYGFTGEFGDISPLLQMTWLDRLWMSGSRLQQEEQELLLDVLEHTDMIFLSDSSTDKGWRHSPYYYAGRDMVGGVYMVE